MREYGFNDTMRRAGCQEGDGPCAVPNRINSIYFRLLFVSISFYIVFMKKSARYAKIVAWSEEDQCYVGRCPGLFYGGCHGDDEQEVFSELCRIVEDTIELYERDRKPLPVPEMLSIA